MTIRERLKSLFRNRVDIELQPERPDFIVKGHSPRHAPRRGWSTELFYQLFMMIADVISEADLKLTGASPRMQKEFARWFKEQSAFTLWQMLEFGYSAVTWTDSKFITVDHKWLTTGEDGRVNLPRAIRWKGVDYTVDWRYTYCLTTETFDIFLRSDFDLLAPFFHLIDSSFSNTQMALSSGGKILMMSPDGGDAHTSAYLDPEQKRQWQEDFVENYATFDSTIVTSYFSNIPMGVNEIDLTGMGESTMASVKDLLLILAGHLRIPANQIPLIDANSSKGFTNGGELIAGDLLKYKTAKRMLGWFTETAESFGMTAEWSFPSEPVNDPSINTPETPEQL